MSEWMSCRLGDIATSYAGGTPDRSKPTYFGGSIPWVKSTEVNHSKIWKTEESLSDIGLQCSAAKWIPANTVLVALYGATAAQIGFLAIRATANQAVLAIIPGAQLNAMFLYYALTAAKARILFQAQGSGQPNLNKQIIDNLLLEIPALFEQRKIARILTTVDDLIEKTEALIAKYQAIKQGMMHDLFTRGVDEHGQLRPTYEEAPELYKESELGWIPKEWEIATLADMRFDISDGNYAGLYPQQSDFVEEGIPFLSALNVREGRVSGTSVKNISIELHSKLTRGHLKPDDVLLTTRAQIGVAALVPKYFVGSNINAQLVRLNGTPEYPSYALCCWFNFLRRNGVIDGFVTGTAQKQLPIGRLLKIPILRAEKGELVAVGMRMRKVEELLSTLENDNYKLSRIKLGLMQDLLTGTVRVLVDE